MASTSTPNTSIPSTTATSARKWPTPARQTLPCPTLNNPTPSSATNFGTCQHHAGVRVESQFFSLRFGRLPAARRASVVSFFFSVFVSLQTLAISLTCSACVRRIAFLFRFRFASDACHQLDMLGVCPSYRFSFSFSLRFGTCHHQARCVSVAPHVLQHTEASLTTTTSYVVSRSGRDGGSSRSLWRLRRFQHFTDTSLTTTCSYTIIRR
jgi:hypothetical protein